MEQLLDQFMTARQIAQRADVPFHKVDYVIHRMRVPEAARVGIVRLFDIHGVESICRALDQIAERRRSAATDRDGGVE